MLPYLESLIIRVDIQHLGSIGLYKKHNYTACWENIMYLLSFCLDDLSGQHVVSIKLFFLSILCGISNSGLLVISVL